MKKLTKEQRKEIKKINKNKQKKANSNEVVTKHVYHG